MDPEHPVGQVEGRKDARTQALGHCCVHCCCDHTSPGAQKFPPGHGHCLEITLGLVERPQHSAT